MGTSEKASKLSRPQTFEEKEFYLDEFRAHTLCFALRWEDCVRRSGFPMLGSVLRDLLANDTRVILLFGLPAGVEVRSAMQRARRKLQSALLSRETAPLFAKKGPRRTIGYSFVNFCEAGDFRSELALSVIWRVLRCQPLLAGFVPQERLLDSATDLATRLRVQKLIIVESLGGIRTPGGKKISFMDAAMLAEVLRAGTAEWAGLAPRRETFVAVQRSLEGGVQAVNLCTLPGLAQELFTYEGSGTLFTLEDYCRVDRLGIDDFEEVERLITRGQREGYLKPRTAEEVTRILLTGYGAAIGAGRHLAGMCALEVEPYRDEQAGEITSLYTITRFKGEGVGVRLLGRVLDDARALGLRYVFACTTRQRAAAFFERQGFRRVPPSQIPPAKWHGYDNTRRRRVRVYRLDFA